MQFVHPIDYAGQYKTNSWPGYYFKEKLGYTSGVHTGVDYNGPGAGDADKGMPVYAIADGIVRYVGDRSDIGFGKTIIYEVPLTDKLKKELGCSSLFVRTMHHDQIHVAVGQRIRRGEAIATVGDTGTEWAHVHIDVYKDTIAYGGVHFNYDKNTRLESYLDPFEFIEAHKNDVEAPSGIFQFEVGVAGNNYRKAPNTTAEIIQEYKSGEILDFKGWVEGQEVDGNNKWLVGAYRNGYSWLGSMKKQDISGMPKLDYTPPSSPPPHIPTPPSEPIPPSAPDPRITEVINKKHPISPENYQPSDLMDIGEGKQLRAVAALAFLKMREAAARDKVNLVPLSGFRTYQYQSNLYNMYVAQDGKEKADTYSARPGFSEHHTGLAVDIHDGKTGVELAFAKTPEYEWLTAHAHEYGFILRYPEGFWDITGYQYEPWHYRYVGVDVAARMLTDGTKTLERFYGVEGGDYAKKEGPLIQDVLTQLNTVQTRVEDVEKFLSQTFKNYKD